MDKGRIDAPGEIDRPRGDGPRGPPPGRPPSTAPWRTGKPGVRRDSDSRATRTGIHSTPALLARSTIQSNEG